MRTAQERGNVRPIARALAVLAAVAVAVLIDPDAAAAQDRTLTFKQAHTGETLTVTYMRNGRHDREALRRINHIFRDWRRNEAIEIDSRLIDILWEVRRAAGSNAPVTVYSAYRSPVTNAALRANSGGVAENSQHTRGRALDFNLPDVPLSRLREVALKFQAGGVGFYPGSGFIHIDTGSVRHWPRMSRQQLANLFPDGKTLHLPSDGRPLPGYEVAKAEAARGTLSGVRSSQVASAGSTGGRGLLAALFGGGGADRQQATAGAAQQRPSAAPASAVAQRPQQAPAAAAPAAPTPPAAAAPTQIASAPAPRSRPASEAQEPAAVEEPTPVPVMVAAAPVPRQRPSIMGGDLIASLLEQPQSLRPEAEVESDEAATVPDVVMALAPARHMEQDLPFAQTFTGTAKPRAAPSRLVALDLRTAALRPYATPQSGLRGPDMAWLRHPRPADLSDLPRTHAATLNTRFASPAASLVKSQFHGAAVLPVVEPEKESASHAQADIGFFGRLFR